MIKGLEEVVRHYDLLIDENNDPVHDPKPLRDYMDRWDGQTFIDKMELDQSKTVLEIGVGSGRLAIRVASYCKHLCGIDISPKTVSRAEENLAEHQNTSLICGDFLAYNFTNTFDVIYSSLTFMHIKEKQRAISKVQSLLNVGGRFVLSVDKGRDGYLDYGTRKIEVYPDSPDEIRGYIANAGLTLAEEYESEAAWIFIAVR